MLCIGIQGIYAVFVEVHICQSVFVCQVLCTGIQGIYALFVGDPSAKVGLAAKLCVLIFKASLLDYLGGHLPKYVHLPSLA